MLAFNHIFASGLLAVAALSTATTTAEQLYNPPAQYYSPKWSFDGISPNWGKRYRCNYYWKVPGHNHYKAYPVFYYPDYPEYVFMYDDNAGKFIYKCASDKHPNYKYWASQWDKCDAPNDPITGNFLAQPPKTPSNTGDAIPRPPCPPDSSSSPPDDDDLVDPT